MSRHWLLASVGALALVPLRLGVGQQGPGTAPAARLAASAGTASATAGRAVLDQYCVTCHNDVFFTSNLSLEKLDLSTVGNHPELWEKVVRKLRAGMMPP